MLNFRLIIIKLWIIDLELILNYKSITINYV